MQFVRIHIRRVHCQREGGTSEPAQVETHKAIMFCVFLHINFAYLLHSEESSCLCVHLKRMSLVQTEEPDADTEVSKVHQFCVELKQKKKHFWEQKAVTYSSE